MAGVWTSAPVPVVDDLDLDLGHPESLDRVRAAPRR